MICRRRTLSEMVLPSGLRVEITFSDLTNVTKDTPKRIGQLFNIERVKRGERGAAAEYKGTEGTGDPRENPPTGSIIRHDSYMRKSWGDPRRESTAGEWSNQYTTAAPRMFPKEHLSAVIRVGIGHSRFSKLLGATVAERLVCSPPTKAIRAQSPVGSPGRCRWSAGFLGDRPLPPPIHSGAAPHSFQSPSSALKTLMLTAAQISSLSHSLPPRRTLTFSAASCLPSTVVQFVESSRRGLDRPRGGWFSMILLRASSVTRPAAMTRHQSPFYAHRNRPAVYAKRAQQRGKFAGLPPPLTIPPSPLLHISYHTHLGARSPRPLPTLSPLSPPPPVCGFFPFSELRDHCNMWPHVFGSSSEFRGRVLMQVVQRPLFVVIRQSTYPPYSGEEFSTPFQHQCVVWCPTGSADWENVVYLQLLQEELPLLLEDIPLSVRRRMIFQHDGAPPHFHCAGVEHLRVHFLERWIGRGGCHP
ncbi:hypothetical protein PR048_023876 [Dryococelus australis]|uniref:Uncharacterized protein n=1 Tax=Dryococelus australis TaxID=614101 RepID=A0ABQ9GV97_9NEOP|nr:hypothetical protein PR048_023876 [Dryococelus australis]